MNIVKFGNSRYNQGNGDRLSADKDESLLGHCIQERGWSLEKTINNLKPLVKHESVATGKAAQWSKVTAVTGFVIGLVGGGTVGAVGMLPLAGAVLAAYVWRSAESCIPRRDLEYGLLKICPRIPEIMLAVNHKGASADVIVSAWDLLLDSYAESEGANADQVVMEFARLLDHVGTVPAMDSLGTAPAIVAGAVGAKPAIAASSPPPTVDTATGFDWQWLNTRYDDYPHVLILGKTGAGKSYLAERLGRFLTGSTLVITPKKKPGTFAGWEVVGVPYNFPAIANRLSAITQLVKDREAEMDRTGREDFEPLNVILDDTPSFIAGCKDEGYDVVKDLKFIIRNARTSKVRLIILVQGAEVKTLGIEGEGSLRDCLSYIRLRGFAEPYAKSLGDVIARQVTAMDRPATVDDMPADVMELCRLSDEMPAPSSSIPAYQSPSPEVAYASVEIGHTEPDNDSIESHILDFLKSRVDGATAGRIRADKKALKTVDAQEIELYLNVLCEEGKLRQDGNIYYHQ